MSAVTKESLASLGNVYDALADIINNVLEAQQGTEEYKNQLEDIRNNVGRLIEAYGGTLPEPKNKK